MGCLEWALTGSCVIASNSGAVLQATGLPRQPAPRSVHLCGKAACTAGAAAAAQGVLPERSFLWGASNMHALQACTQLDPGGQSPVVVRLLPSQCTSTAACCTNTTYKAGPRLHVTTHTCTDTAGDVSLRKAVCRHSNVHALQACR